MKFNCICRFCQNDLGNIHVSSESDAPLTHGHPSSLECKNCNVRYVYRRDGTLHALHGYVIWAFYQNKKYVAHFWEKVYFESTNKVLFKLSKDGLIEIFTLDYHPNINPSNFSKKLPTLLIFL